MNKNISILIKGNLTSGNIPIVRMGDDPSFDVDYHRHSLGNECTSYFSVKIENGRTIYQYVLTNIHSYIDAGSSGSRASAMYIVIAIPEGNRLTDGKTPYDVLCRLKDVFFEKGMSQKDPARGIYEYKYRDPALYEDILDDVVKEFSLEETKVRLRPMNGDKIGCIIRSEQEIREFFKDIRYDFSEYKEILVADERANITSSQDYFTIDDIEIPRQPMYTVIVDKNNQGIYRKDYLLPVSPDPHGKFDKKYYNIREERFSIAQIINREKHIEGVQVDEETEVVTVNTTNWVKPKKKTITITIDPRGLKDKVLGNLEFYYLDYHITPNNENLTLEGDKIKYFDDKLINVRVQQSGRDKYEICGSLEYISTDESHGEIIIKVKKKEEVRMPPQNNGQGYNKAPKGGPSTNSCPNSSEPASEKPMHCVEITLTANEKVYGEMKDGEATVLLRGSNKGTLIRTKVKFSNEGNGNNNTYTGHFYSDEDFVVKHISKLGLVVQTKKTEYYSNISNVKINEKRLSLNIESDLSNQKKISFFRKHRKGIAKIIIAFVSFGIGICVGSHFTSSQVGEIEISEENEEFDVKQFLSDADESLRDSLVTFTKVTSIYNDYNRHKTEIDEMVQSGAIKDTVSVRIVGHYNFAQYIMNNKIDSIEEYVQHSEEYHIWKLHSNRYKDIPNDNNKKERFKNKCNEINSFADVDLLYEYCCNDCNKYFDSQEEQEKHLKKCDTCDRMICTKKMEEHKATHNPLPKDPPSTQGNGDNNEGAGDQKQKIDTSKSR